MTSKWVQQVAIEDVTYAPNLNAAPSPGCADSVVVAANCSREPLIAFTDGQTGTTNPDQPGQNHPRPGITAQHPDGSAEPTAQFD